MVSTGLTLSDGLRLSTFLGSEKVMCIILVLIADITKQSSKIAIIRTNHWSLKTNPLNIKNSVINNPDGGMARMQIIPMIRTKAPAGYNFIYLPHSSNLNV